MDYNQWYNELVKLAREENVEYLVNDKDDELLHDVFNDGESPCWILNDLIMDSISDC